MDFLQKEVPSNAADLNSSINNTLEIIEHIRSALKSKLSSMAGNFLEDSNYNEIIKEFRYANKQLESIESNLCCFFNNDIQTDFDTSEDILIEENDNDTIAEDEEEEIEEREWKIDYKKYLVDNTKPYPLTSDFENTTPDRFSFRGEMYKVKTYKEMWLKLCEILYNKDNNKFKEIATWHQIKGHKKSYIVYETDKIAQNITNPLRFLNTGIILEGTTSTTQKTKIMLKLLDLYKISSSSVKVYLKSDRHPKHGQEPIGIYEDKTYDYKAEIEANINSDNNRNIEGKSEIPIAKRAYSYFQSYFQNKEIVYDVEKFLDKNWCKEVLNISYPLFKRIDNTKPIGDQTVPDGKTNPYYAQNPQIYINGDKYMIYMKWTEKMHRNQLEKWISEHPISNIEEVIISKSKSNCIDYDFKKDLCGNLDNPLFNQPCTSANSCKFYSEQTVVYIVSKEVAKNKCCPCCGIKGENKMLDVTYTKDNITALAVVNRLQILHCKYCGKKFININVYNTYTNNKNLDDLNVKFMRGEL